MAIESKYDAAVVGGGPAGMMAAIKASAKGARVILIEKNFCLGKKLLITGGGRCNVTQANLNNREFAEKLGKNGKFLLSALSVFGQKETIKFFEQNGLKTKIERGGRVFPVSDNSRDVLNILLRCLEKNKVKILLNQKVLGFDAEQGKIKSVRLKDKKIFAKNFILAAGGVAYPGTGSTGEGYLWAQKLGHKIIKPSPALTPIKIREKWVAGLAGLALKNARVSVWQNNKKQTSRFGEALFTHFGLSGPIILDLSKEINGFLAKGAVILQIDLKPALDTATMDKRLQRDFQSNKNFKNYLPDLIPQKLSDLIIQFTNIPPDKKLNFIDREERKKIIGFLKNLPLTVNGLLGFEQALITSGGVDLKEIDSRTMRSKIVKNLFFAGEIIDLDGPTGGYNLQICWTTGWAAGNNL